MLPNDTISTKKIIMNNTVWKLKCVTSNDQKDIERCVLSFLEHFCEIVLWNKICDGDQCYNANIHECKNKVWYVECCDDVVLLKSNKSLRSTQVRKIMMMNPKVILMLLLKPSSTQSVENSISFRSELQRFLFQFC